MSEEPRYLVRNRGMISPLLEIQELHLVVKAQLVDGRVMVGLLSPRPSHRVTLYEVFVMMGSIESRRFISASLLRRIMKASALAISLILILVSLSGCAGVDDAPIGEWWSLETIGMEINEDGTLIDSEGNLGTWKDVNCGGQHCMINMTITFHESKETWTISEGADFTYAVEGDWLWLRQVSHDCHKLSSGSISEDEWNASASDRPPIC